MFFRWQWEDGFWISKDLHWSYQNVWRGSLWTRHWNDTNQANGIQKSSWFLFGNYFHESFDLIWFDLALINFSSFFVQVSKWKLYKTARKRGIYAEIKKQNQAQVIILNRVEEFKKQYGVTIRNSHLKVVKCNCFHRHFWTKRVNPEIKQIKII